MVGGYAISPYRMQEKVSGRAPTMESLGEPLIETMERKSRVWLCSAQLVLMFNYLLRDISAKSLNPIQVSLEKDLSLKILEVSIKAIYPGKWLT